jgi:TolB-like protein
MDAVWTDTHVTDDSLVQCISEIRKALGPDARLLFTVPKKGYRLNGGHIDGPAETARPQRRLLLAAGASGVVLAALAVAVPQFRSEPPTERVDDVPTLAVLPFQSLGSDEDQYFSDGLTEDLIMALSRVSGLRTLAPASVFGFREEAVGTAQIADELGADFIVAGSLRRFSSGIRVNAHMTDPTTGERVWTESFDREGDAVLALQDDVVRQIVTALSVELQAGELAERSDAEKVNAQAYDLLLRGLDHYRRFTREDNLIARDLFRRATDIDPGFARAYADLALTYVWEIQLTAVENPEDVVRQGLALTRHALALDGDNIYALFALSVIHRTLREHEAALRTAERVVRINPGFADGYALRALTQNYAGQPNEALASIRLAIQLNPRAPFFYNFIEGQAFYLTDDLERAVRRLEFAREQNPEFVPTRKLLAVTYVGLGMQDDADWEVVEITVRQPRYTLVQERLSSPYASEVVFSEYVERLDEAGLRFAGHD